MPVLALTPVTQSHHRATAEQENFAAYHLMALHTA
jgi:hypothetical protein